MAAGVVCAAVRLDLDDANRAIARDEHLVQEKRAPARAGRGGRSAAGVAYSAPTRSASLAQGNGEPLELVGDRSWPRAARRRAPAHRDTWLEQTDGLVTERGVCGYQFGERDVTLERIAHEAADDGMRLAERRALGDKPLGEIGRGRERRVSGRAHAIEVEAGSGEQPAQRGQAEPRSGRTASNSGSLSSCRSRLYASGRPLSVASKPVRLPIRRPALPRSSSATSGFFFCGSIELPVA